MTYRIFISSVQREFAKERRALADYIRKDAILGRFFDVFLFEEVPAQERSADNVYLREVDNCDIYLGILGHTYGNTDASGVSATEREYNRAFKRHKSRICFVNKGYIEKAGTGTEDMIAKCEEWGIPAPEWIEEDADNFRVVLRRPVAQGNLDFDYDESRDWNIQKHAETGGNSAKIASGNELKSRDKNGGKSRDGIGDMTTQQTTQETTQQTTQETTQQTTNRRLLQLVPPGNMRNIVSIVMKNPHININGMADVLGLSTNGVKYHIKRIRKLIKFRHIGALQAGRWEIGPKETP